MRFHFSSAYVMMNADSQVTFPLKSYSESEESAMKITYIKHSGYLLESDQALLLFDF